MLSKIFVVLSIAALAFAESTQKTGPTYQPDANQLQQAQNDQPAYPSDPAPVYAPYPIQQQVAPVPQNGPNQYQSEGYAPAYGYEPAYGAQPGYENYMANGPDAYGELEPVMPGPFSLLWSMLPIPKTFLGIVGKTASLVFTGASVLAAGLLVTFLTCTFTPFCSISFNHIPGFGTIHEEMRSLMTPEKLATATDFVKSALDKYEKIQRVQKIKNQRRR